MEGVLQLVQQIPLTHLVLSTETVQQRLEAITGRKLDDVQLSDVETKFTQEELEDESYQLDKINPGIRETVIWLRQNGFNTQDSGDGKTHDFSCDLSIPYVHMVVPVEKLVSETLRLRDLLRERGIELAPTDPEGTHPSIEASFNPADGVGGTISLWNVKL